MTPLVLGLGPTELLIILAVVLLLFGGSRLAGLGRSSGRAIREFKEETRAAKDEDTRKAQGELQGGQSGPPAAEPKASDPVGEPKASDPVIEKKPEEFR